MAMNAGDLMSIPPLHDPKQICVHLDPRDMYTARLQSCERARRNAKEYLVLPGDIHNKVHTWRKTVRRNHLCIDLFDNHSKESIKSFLRDLMRLPFLGGGFLEFSQFIPVPKFPKNYLLYLQRNTVWHCPWHSEPKLPGHHQAPTSQVRAIWMTLRTDRFQRLAPTPKKHYQ